MKHQLSSGVLLALALEGCGLLVDLPDVGLGNEGGASSGGFEGDGDGDGDGDADGDGDGDLNGDGDLSGDGDGDLMMNSGGLGGAMNLGGAGAGNGGTNTGGALTPEAPPQTQAGRRAPADIAASVIPRAIAMATERCARTKSAAAQTATTKMLVSFQDRPSSSRQRAKTKMSDSIMTAAKPSKGSPATK